MFSVDSSDPTPIYAQLERAIRAEIAAGRLRVGDRLPSVLQLAVDLRVNANTVARVYAELERAGVVHTQRGLGTFVRELVDFAPDIAEKRDRALRQVTDRLLAEAHTIGLTIDDVIRHLESRQALKK
jgi:GntR family transcriptional regulator